MTLNKLRGKLYALASALGDIQAITHKNPGKAIPKRIGRRIAGKLMGRLMGCIFPPSK
jgi:hypothetical protein